MRKRQYGSKKLIIEFHRTYLIMALGFVLTGYYLNLIIFTSLIIVHELGHYTMAKINHFHVSKIIIYPYGGLTKIEDLINRSISEELLIATSGVITQYSFYLIIGILYKQGIIREYTYYLYTIYNSQMIFFNLLPIYPLDGGKITNLILDKYFPFYQANILTIIISLLIIITLTALNIYKYSYSNIMVMLLLLTYLYNFFKKRKYLYQRFLLERYLYHIEYPKIKVIKNIKKMFKDRTHLINIKNTYLTEQQVLSNLFKEK